MDYSRFHNRLTDFLHLKGIKTGPGNIPCFDPRHVHSGKNTPSMKIGYNDKEGKETFICYSGNCGVHGDIYDAVEILEGITDKKEQFLYLEKIFGGGYVPPPAPGSGDKKTKKKFIASPEALKQVENYLSKNPAAEKEIIKYLNMRAAVSTLGVITSYPADLIPAMVKYFLYWPGLDLVRRDMGTDILFKAGISLQGSNGLPSFWEHSGVILKIGRGFKLHYYIEGNSKKYNSKDTSTFPMPGTIDKTKPVILVEGEMDAVSSVAAGIENLFSAGGTNGLTKDKIKEFLLDVPEVIFCFDGDDPGRKASGLIPFAPDDKDKTNRPEILRQAGYTGKIKIAELPLTDKENDPDALVIAGKREVILKAIREAKEYTPPDVKAENKAGIKWDYLPVKRLQSLLRNITKAMILEKDPADLQIFISAIIKAAKKPELIKTDLEKWGAEKEQIENKNGVTAYALVELAWKYELSSYTQKIIKTELTPASELLKRLKVHEPIVPIDYDSLETDLNLTQFVDTKGVRSAALMVADIINRRLIYVENEKSYYFFDGHVWIEEPDVTGVIYNIIHSIVYYYLKKLETNDIPIEKSVLEEIIFKIEGRRFRVEIMQEFSQLRADGVFKKNVPFDGPAMQETLTLKDGVFDFSGKEIMYRKSAREEYRRAVLPYTMEEIKNAENPNNFIEFMKGNFKDEKTLESLLYYLSLIPSRNTQFKYGGVFIGETNTGKTTTMEIIRSVFPEMIQILPAEILVSKGLKQVDGNQASPYISSMEGKGASLSSETGRNLYLNNALWKLLTGNDPIPTRDLYQKSRNFVPTAQVIILSNYLPLFDSHDNATIGRMVIIPFLVEHKRGKQIDIKDFIRKIENERPAIVKYLAEYYIKLKNDFKGEIPLSDECKKYKKAYIEELETNVDRFVKDCIKFDVADDAFLEVKEVYARYLKYFNFKSEDEGKDALTQHKFTRYFKRDYKLVYEKQKKIKGEVVQCFYNVRFKTDEERFGEPRREDETPAKGGVTPPPDENPFE